jgi:hypothetical protein
MAAKAAIYVSKRLQRPVVAIMCLFAAQLIMTLASCQPEPTAMAARAGASVRVPIMPSAQ